MFIHILIIHIALFFMQITMAINKNFPLYNIVLIILSTLSSYVHMETLKRKNHSVSQSQAP